MTGVRATKREPIEFPADLKGDGRALVQVPEGVAYHGLPGPMTLGQIRLEVETMFKARVMSYRKLDSTIWALQEYCLSNGLEFYVDIAHTTRYGSNGRVVFTRDEGYTFRLL